jgi:hypothetical protein
LPAAAAPTSTAPSMPFTTAMGDRERSRDRWKPSTPSSTTSSRVTGSRLIAEMAQKHCRGADHWTANPARHPAPHRRLRDRRLSPTAQALRGGGAREQLLVGGCRW